LQPLPTDRRRCRRRSRRSHREVPLSAIPLQTSRATPSPCSSPHLSSVVWENFPKRFPSRDHAKPASSFKLKPSLQGQRRGSRQNGTNVSRPWGSKRPRHRIKICFVPRPFNYPPRYSVFGHMPVPGGLIVTNFNDIWLGTVSAVLLHSGARWLLDRREFRVGIRNPYSYLVHCIVHIATL
jgi:hypothetical protein